MIFAVYRELTLLLCNFPYLRIKWNVKADGDGDSEDRTDGDRCGEDAGDDRISYFLLLCYPITTKGNLRKSAYLGL